MILRFLALDLESNDKFHYVHKKKQTNYGLGKMLCFFILGEKFSVIFIMNR